MLEAGTKRRGGEATKGNQARRRGFSFPEILFAVAVLGIGFIMVAAIFPVAIMQTQATMDETLGNSATRNSSSYLRGTQYWNSSAAGLPPTTNPPDSAIFPPTPNPKARVFSFYDPRNTAPAPAPTPAELWGSVRNNLIVPEDPRFAYVPLYQREGGSSFIKLISIAVRVRNRDVYVASATAPEVPDTLRAVSPANVCAELEPRPVRILTSEGGASADQIQIENVTNTEDPLLQPLSANSNAVEAAVEGAYVVISDDRLLNVGGTPDGVNEEGRLNGVVYRLGTMLGSAPGVRTFELAPGDDMPASPGPDGAWGTGDDISQNIPARNVGAPPPGSPPRYGIAFVVGAGYASRSSRPNYSGPNQAVQKLESLIKLP